MLKSWKKVLLGLSAMLSSAAVIIVLFSGIFAPAFASQSASSVTGNVVVNSACTISISNTLLSFGGSAGVAPGTLSTANVVFDTNDGNAQSWIWSNAGNWIGPQTADNGNFFVSNTLYGATSTPTISESLTSANTGIFLPAPSINQPTTNSIYFAVNVPVGTAAGVFLQTITITNIC